LAAALAKEAPTDAVHAQLAYGHNGIGWMLWQMGKLAEALKALEQGRDIRQALVDANPTVISFQSALADSHENIGAVLQMTGKLAEALKAFEKVRDIRQKQADANRDVTSYQSDLAPDGEGRRGFERPLAGTPRPDHREAQGRTGKTGVGENPCFPGRFARPALKPCRFGGSFVIPSGAKGLDNGH
jgi:tetratricopeptide (TPR) repeat protein